MITVIEDKSEYKNENIVRLTEIVFDKCGVGGDLVIKDWDINRIYITKERRSKWMIRTWNIRKNSKGRVVIDWTLFKMKPDGSNAERDKGRGRTVIKNKKEGRT